MRTFDPWLNAKVEEAEAREQAALAIFDRIAERKSVSVGMPADLLLEEFGYQVWAAFGHTAYHTGSSVFNKTWRDVDVRLILPDDEYERMGLGDPEYPHHNAKWVALVLAFSALGKAMTGLPIDFQIQQQSYANEKFSQKNGCIRSGLGCEARIRQVDANMSHHEKDVPLPFDPDDYPVV